MTAVPATSRIWVYPVDLRREVAEMHAYCSQLPEAIAAGADEVAALREMREALAAAVRGRIKDGMPLELPGDGIVAETYPVALPSLIVAKAAIHAAQRSADLCKVALAERIGRGETEVRRILDPDHRTRIDQFDEAVEALGGRLVVSFERA